MEDLSIMPINIAINIVAIFFFDFLAAVYLSKKKVVNYENKIYTQMLLWNFLDLHCHLLYLLVAYFFRIYWLFNFISAIHLSFLLFYFFFTLCYIIIVSIEKNEELMQKIYNNEKKIKRIIVVVLVIFMLGQLLAPGETIHVPGGMYLGGISSYYWYFIDALMLICCFTFLTVNRKSVDFVKIAPFIIFIILIVIDIVITILFPALCPIVVIVTLMTYVMYHTIENPDLKLVNKLELAKEQAEKSNNAKTDFLSSMSHEIRTPLNTIVGLSQMIKEADNLDSVKKDANDVFIASQNLLEIVNGILDINKLEANQMEIVECTYNPIDVFNSLANLMKIRVGTKPIEIRTYFVPELPKALYGDKEKLRQIISNLLTNAIKYTEKGFVDFDVFCKNKKDKCELTITVKDTGRGISVEQQKKLYDKFNRLEQDKDSDISGTGLGLAITKALVELLNGTISVDSLLGQGSTFTVTISQRIITDNSTGDIVESVKVNDNSFSIPDAKDSAQVIEKNPSTTNVGDNNIHKENSSSIDNSISSIIEDASSINFNGNHRKVLVVDDNKINLKVASKMLLEFNFDVDMANSGSECLNIIDQKKYDLIFMDIMMPEMNGVETMKKLKEKVDFNTPIIALTADAMNGAREKYLEDGFDEYIAKPISKRSLFDVLGKFLSNDSNISDDSEEIL